MSISTNCIGVAQTGDLVRETVVRSQRIVTNNTYWWSYLTSRLYKKVHLHVYIHAITATNNGRRSFVVVGIAYCSQVYLLLLMKVVKRRECGCVPIKDQS